MVIKETASALLLLAFLLPAGGRAADQGLAITIHVYNYAKVEQDTLGDAKKKVAGIFHKAGVETLWAALGDDLLSRLPNIYIVIIPGSMSNRLTLPRNVPKDALGFTPGAGPDRDRAYVFYSNVKALAMSFGEASYANTVNMLGCAITHEIGHLLLEFPSHSPTGIMRTAWDLGDLAHASDGELLFTRQQARMIRQEVGRRTDVLNLRVPPCEPSEGPFCTANTK